MKRMEREAARIEDYALIGDCETAALVGRDGSIDWLCLPRFDSAACFAALLGTPEHGRWRIAPAVAVMNVRRWYHGATLVLETEFTTASGTVALVDFMPMRSGRADLVRLVVGRSGRVPMRLELAIRFDYGSIVPWVRRLPRGISVVGGPDSLLLRTPVELHGEDYRTIAEFEVSEGERVPFDMTWFPSHEQPEHELDPEAALRQTEEWWSDWSTQCTYEGPWRDAVRRRVLQPEWDEVLNEPPPSAAVLSCLAEP